MSALSIRLGKLWKYTGSGLAEAWQKPLRFLGLAWIALLILFWRDAADMAMIWWNSSTFNHCLLILPILVWLVIQRKEQLAELKPQPWKPALFYVGAGAFGWLLGDAAGLAVARQLGLLMMLQGSVAALLGPNVTRGLMFPLFYMFFLLPIGEEAVPALQTLTAKMCMIFLGWAGIPAHIDGIFITTPGGYFKVAEACSGVKFLIAMVALGALVSNLCFTRWSRRAAFMAACVIIPIIANSIRAFGTIYIAEYSGIDFAASFDHVFYGWIFFGIVIALVMAMGWRFFDRRADAIAFDPLLLQSPIRHGMTLKAALFASLVLALVPVGWSSVIASRPSPVPDQVFLPQVTNWEIIPYSPIYDWTPRFDGASHQLLGRYRDAAGQTVDLYVAVFDRQSEERELIGFGQGAVNPDSEWVWTSNIAAPTGAKGERITAPGPISREVISYYRVDGVTSGSSGRIKLATTKARLLGGNQQAVAILISAEGASKSGSRHVIDRFIKDLGNIDNLADRMAGLR